MKPVDLARERKMSEKRRLKREAAEPKHVPPPVGNMARTGRKIDYSDAFVPPDDLTVPHRRMR